MSSVLVVEDFEPFRQFIHTILQESELQIVGEASDGLEAFQKAEELQPDVILLDIGLPTLNGIEAARQIRKLSPPIQDTFREPGILSGCYRTGSQFWRNRLRR
jgi:DNA-binding NarL/FixJ family response regulator